MAVYINYRASSYRPYGAYGRSHFAAGPDAIGSLKLSEKHPAEVEFLKKELAKPGSSSFREFLKSVYYGASRYGSFSEKQLAAVQKAMAKAAEPYVPKAPDANIAGEGFAKLVAGFSSAKGNGLKRPKIRVGDLVFSLAGANSANYGSLYVKAGSVYLGKISEGGDFRKSYDCSPAQVAEIEAVGKDPVGALVAHGKKYGNCGICGRELSDPASVERGIGPICASKFGWG